MSLESSLKELIPNLTCPVHLAVELAELVELVVHEKKAEICSSHPTSFEAPHFLA